MNDIQVVPKCVSVRVSRPCILSVYRVRVSCPCILSVYRVRANIRDHTSVSFTPHPSDFDGLKTAPSAPSGINVARNVSRDVSRNVARDVGWMRQYEHLTGAGSPPLFYISHNLSVEMGDFTDKLLTLNNLSVKTCLFTDKPVIFGVNPCQDYARLSISR